MPDLLEQIQSFILTLIVGMLFGIIIHYYQLTIRKSRINKYFLYFIDFILWILLMGIISICLLLINMGEMRAYVLIALFIGLLVYYRLLSHYFTRPLNFGAQATIAFFSLVKRITGKPFIWLLENIRSFLSKFRQQPPDEED